MKSDKIKIDNCGNGFQDAVEETQKVAVFEKLNPQNSLRLQLITEEMLSMARSITGRMEAFFWLENDGSLFELHMSTKSVLDKVQRNELISVASSRKNEAAKSFLGWLRDVFENAMIAEGTPDEQTLALDLMNDLSGRSVDDPYWDGYERSVLRKLADNIKIGIRGAQVDMVVIKDFGK